MPNPNNPLAPGLNGAAPKGPRTIWDNPVLSAVLAIIMGFAMWIIVTVYIDPQGSTTVTGVPINYTSGASTYTAQGLDIVEKPDIEGVTVKVEGNSTIIGNIRSADIMVYPSYAGVSGAGTFSDGKLTTRVGDPLCAFVTGAFLDHGAPADIAWRQKPHVGTDLLRGVIRSIRGEIEALGGEVRFNTALTGLHTRNGALTGIETTAGPVPCEQTILAVGHSARDTFAMLHGLGLPLECKPFSVGFRAEHLQTEIDKSLYHGAAGHPALPKGEYQLSQHVSGGRCVYTFCMCPGGTVCAAASEAGGVVTNGMSLHARDGRNANAAVVVSVDGGDFDNDPAKAVAFQRRLEQAAYRAGGGNYLAPAETVGSFLAGRGALELGAVQPTYPRGVTPCDLGSLLPDDLSGALREGLTAFGRKLAAYRAPDAVLTGLETRTSSPVRLLRDKENLQCTGLAGLYPCGEGAGYAGGIMTAAVDGVRCAAELMKNWGPMAD